MKITFVPEDQDIFKNKIIETKCATRHIEYMDGTIREEPWRIKRLGSIPKFLLKVASSRGSQDEK